MGHKRIIGHSSHRIYDPIRNKYVAYTPEEHVRQRLLNYLLEIKGYPKGLISVERSFEVNGQARRYDIVVFRPDNTPFLLAECKSPKVDLSPKNDALIRQILAYQLAIQAPFLLLSNGQTLLCFARHKQQFQAIDEVPAWQELSSSAN